MSSKRVYNLDIAKLDNYLLTNNISKSSLDKRIGVSCGYVSKCIRGNNTMSEIVYKLMCGELNVPYDYFIQEELPQLDRIEKKLDELLSYWR